MELNNQALRRCRLERVAGGKKMQMTVLLNLVCVLKLQVVAIKNVGDVAVCDLLRGGLATSCDDDRVGDLAVFG